MSINVTLSREGSVTSSRPASRALHPESYLHRRPEQQGRTLSVPNLQLRPPFLDRSQRFQSFSHSLHAAAPTYRPRPYFRSRRIKKGTTDRPELREYDPRQKWVTIIPIMGFLLGLTSITFLAWDGWRSVANHVYCPVFVDDFSNGFNSTIWTKEVENGGYNNGEFEMTTGGDENVFVRDGMLIIKPTVETESYIASTSLVNLTADGTCTSSVSSDCVDQANQTSGEIVQPTKSGRINTKNFAVIRYGRVEVEAKLAAGQWLVSEIMMWPAEDYYGPWPQSGQIDIAMTRGNNYTYPGGGNQIVQSDLHWGPDVDDDRWDLTNNVRKVLHTTFSQGFHTFGLEWSKQYLFTWVDKRLAQVFYVKFNEDFFAKGDFSPSQENGSLIVDPWTGDGTSHATPFDRPFFLTLAVAVGGTSGWFEDGVQGKPWADSSDTARKDFWNARDVWEPTWEEHGAELQVKKVSMWQQCDDGAQFL